MKLKAKTSDGRTIDLWPRDPLGHVNKPMDDEDVKNKFHQTVERFMAEKKRLGY